MKFYPLGVIIGEVEMLTVKTFHSGPVGPTSSSYAAIVAKMEVSQSVNRLSGETVAVSIRSTVEGKVWNGVTTSSLSCVCTLELCEGLSLMFQSDSWDRLCFLCVGLWASPSCSNTKIKKRSQLLLSKPAASSFAIPICFEAAKACLLVCLSEAVNT